MDDCLALYRTADGVPVQVHRAGRILEVPCTKPVILRSGDELFVAGRRFRVFTHGWIEKTYAPYCLKERLKGAMKTAAALVMGAALTTTAACDDDIDVRDQPPNPMPLDAGDTSDEGTDTGTSASPRNDEESDVV